MTLGVHLVTVTLPGGPASIGPTLSTVGRAAMGDRCRVTMVACGAIVLPRAAP